MPARAIMIQGTTSNAGKSMLATGLCRLLRRRGLSVAPFKPQNMALNSAVTADGGEIGRAQALQAQACGLAAHTDMNPVLLKPSSSTGAQIIVQGQVFGHMDAQAYHDLKPALMPYVLESYRRLASRHDCLVIEGAGSPAEINLRQGDIANMGFAEAVDCPVLIIADIDRGGVFAHLCGTLDILSASERQRVCALVINRFRGDLKLLEPGLQWLARQSGKPVLGVLPYLNWLRLDAEDSLSQSAGQTRACAGLRVVVAQTPRLSNVTDIDPLLLLEQVDVSFVGADESMPAADLIVLCGSKNVPEDLAFLRASGWDDAIRRHLRYGGKVIGICGGFQMLGQFVHDPLALESAAGTSPGLGLLDMETTLKAEKRLANVEGTLAFGGAPVSGYEIHMGLSSGPALARPAVILSDGADGAVSADNQIFGTYVHGIFDKRQACAALLSWAGLKAPVCVDYQESREKQIDGLADVIEKELDLKIVYALLAGAVPV